jgi:ubiquinone/menaquinone biosynthesis C-methylase UbiE
MFHPEGPSFFELARQALSSTVHGYDLIAEKFDYTPFCTPPKLINAAFEYLPRADAGLDLCCGTGAGISLLSQLCTRVVGLDFSQGMLDVARRRFPDAELIHGDALVPRWHEEFELVTCFGALGHFLPEDMPAFVDVVHRALKPGGTFAFFTLPRTGGPELMLYAFDLAIRIRNLLIKPEFVMYYRACPKGWLPRLMKERGFVISQRKVMDTVLVTALKA